MYATTGALSDMNRATVSEGQPVVISRERGRRGDFKICSLEGGPAYRIEGRYLNFVNLSQGSKKGAEDGAEVNTT